MQPTPVLFLGSDLQSLSLGSQPPLLLAGEQTSVSGWGVLVGTYPLCGKLATLPPAPLLLHSLLWLQIFPCPLPIPVSEGASLCVETFPPSQLLPRGAGPVPILLSLFFLFSFALPRYVGSFLPFGKSEVFYQRSVGVL